MHLVEACTPLLFPEAPEAGPEQSRGHEGAGLHLQVSPAAPAFPGVPGGLLCDLPGLCRLLTLCQGFLHRQISDPESHGQGPALLGSPCSQPHSSSSPRQGSQGRPPQSPTVSPSCPSLSTGAVEPHPGVLGFSPRPVLG